MKVVSAQKKKCSNKKLFYRKKNKIRRKYCCYPGHCLSVCLLHFL